MLGLRTSIRATTASPPSYENNLDLALNFLNDFHYFKAKTDDLETAAIYSFHIHIIPYSIPYIIYTLFHLFWYKGEIQVPLKSMEVLNTDFKEDRPSYPLSRSSPVGITSTLEFRLVCCAELNHTRNGYFRLTDTVYKLIAVQKKKKKSISQLKAPLLTKWLVET